jgi:uncharacterized protein (DUF58 family)
VRREPLARLLRRLRWTVHRPLATYLGGEERSLLRGRGVELVEIREYQPGDDVRLIDWNTTARADRAYVREALVERGLDAWLAVDVSGSIDWGTTNCPKRERALELVAVAGELLTRQGNRVGALFFADRPLDVVPPAAGRTALLGMLDRLRRRPRQAATGRTDLAAALGRVDALARRRSLVLVVSDFAVPTGWERALGRLAARHEVVAVRVTDPRERDLPDIGLATFEDPETGQQLVVDTGHPALRARYRAAVAARDEAMCAALARHDVPLLALSTDAEILPALAAFLISHRRARSRRGRLPAAV